MYLDFFELKEKPFSLTPDPRFLFLSESHRQALDHLIYGIQEHEGFILIVGDIGTGKTTICRELLERLDKSVASALILNPMLSEQELLEAIVQDFDIRFDIAPKEGETGEESRKIFENLDSETQNALELNPLITTKQKLLQIVLVGQLELKRKLEQPDLRQLNQRISIRYRLKPLTYEETKRYVEHRLFIAGSNSSVTFTDEAYRNIYDYSSGVPRLVNLICERCLLAAYVDQVRKVDSDLVLRCRDSLEGDLEEPDGTEESRPLSEKAVAGPWERQKEGFLSWLLDSQSKSRKILLLFLAALAAASLLLILFSVGMVETWQGKAPQTALEQKASLSQSLSPAVRLAFSIQLGAFQNLDGGLEQMRLLSEQGLQKQLYIVPLHIVQLGGRWYRLFCGGFPSKTSARAELNDLVDRGIIKAGSARILETSLAFNLGDFTDRRVAEGKRSQYMNRWRIPAYIFQLEIRDETPVYRLYAGAFEEREQASFLADRIEEAGLSQVLVERLGSWPLR